MTCLVRGITAIDHHDFRAPGPGGWRRLADHFPGALTAEYQRIYAETCPPGMATYMERYGVLARTLDVAFVHGHLYIAPVPLAGPREPATDAAARAGVAAVAAAPGVPPSQPGRPPRPRGSGRGAPSPRTGSPSSAMQWWQRNRERRGGRPVQRSTTPRWPTTSAPVASSSPPATCATSSCTATTCCPSGC